jgi:hypothetical protein
MSWVGFEPTERAKAVHALDRSANITVAKLFTLVKKSKSKAIPVTGREGP